MSSIKDVVARGSVQELEEWVAAHKGAEVNKDVLRWATESDSVEILKEWMDLTEEPMVIKVALQLAPVKVSGWLVEEGKLLIPDNPRNKIHWRTWMRLLRLDKEHPCYVAKFAESLRTLNDDTSYWVIVFLACIVERGTLEELEWLEKEFGTEIWSGISLLNLLRNPDVGVVERFYDSVESLGKPNSIWGAVSRNSTPAVAEVVRRRLTNTAGTKYAKPKVSDLREAMRHGNLAMYRWIGEEYGFVAKCTKKMFLACCEYGEPDDVRSYWIDTPAALAEGAIGLFARGMWELVEELTSAQATKPDERTLTRCVRGRMGDVKILQGIILMGWKGLIRAGRRGELMKELDRIALRRGFQPWVSDTLAAEGIFFTREDILSSRYEI